MMHERKTTKAAGSFQFGRLLRVLILSVLSENKKLLISRNSIKFHSDYNERVILKVSKKRKRVKIVNMRKKAEIFTVSILTFMASL